MNMLRRKNNSY